MSTSNLRATWHKLLTVFGAFILLGASLGQHLSGRVLLANGSPARGAVVWLQGAAKSRPLKSAVIDQRDLRFDPHVLVVTKGTKVNFPNSDTVSHNVFAEYNAKKFDLGMYPRGVIKTVTFDKPGLVALLCSVHSEMSAYIIVVDTPYYAVTDKDGRFRIEVEPGAYTMNVWHETKQTLTKSISMGQTDQTCELRTDHSR